MIASDVLATLLSLMPAPRRAARAAWAPHPRSSVRVASPFYPSDHERTKKSPKMSEECGEVEGRKNPENVRGMLRTERTEKIIKKKECNTRTSQEVTHPSTTLAQARLTSEF